jgi:adenine-specific DNA-methyltransferase
MPRRKPAKSKATKSTAAKKPAARKTAKAKAPAKKASSKKSVAKTSKAKRAHHALAPKARAVKQYDHPSKKRLNNPPVGLVTPDTDPDLTPKTYAYDPHLDPQLVWTGKQEKAELTVDTVSLHVHERIDSHTIISSVRNQDSFVEQPSLFAKPAENPPLREAIDFYKHQHEWSNRLIAGDSTLVMNSLLEREGMAGQIQAIYIDPPYGVKYASNFQPFVNKRNVTDGSDEDLTQEPEMIRAFRDTWELGIHSYLSYLRERLHLARELLTQSGSCFVQISDDNVHLIRALMDETFSAENFISQISFRKTSGASGNLLATTNDYIVWYAKDKASIKYRQLYLPKELGGSGSGQYTWGELPDGTRKNFGSAEKLAEAPAGTRIFRPDNITSQRPAQDGDLKSFTFEGRQFGPGKGTFKTDERGLKALAQARRLMAIGNTLCYVRYLDDFPVFPVTSVWDDTGSSGFADPKMYVVQTLSKVVQRCIMMTTDPGDIVLDPTCGSGTTAVAAEQWGRRWITCDTSRVAVTLAKQRLMTASFPYYELADEQDGVDGGFKYKTVPHIGLKTIANGEPPPQEALYDQPFINKDKVRITGPFTVEAVPSPMVAEMNHARQKSSSDVNVARSGATQRHADWRGELLKTGVRGIGGALVKFSRVEPLAGTKFLHAEAETAEEKPRRVAISFGPEYAPLEQRQVEAAWEEARNLDPRPDILLFAAFQFDAEAAKDIDEMPPAVTKKTTFLKVQMNPDLLTGDLKKKRASNQSFWLVGRPDVELSTIKSGEGKGKYQVAVHGFDYYDVKTGEITSGDASRIAMWMLDPDYDGRSLFPRQVFFPNAGPKDGWNRLAKTLRAELDEELLEAYLGTESLPFAAGQHNRIAVKIIDNRGIESLRVLELP